MTLTIDWQTVITASAVVAACVALISRFAKGVRWFDRQGKQDDDLRSLREMHNQDMERLRTAISKELGSVNTEQTLLTYGVLACLKGLKEQGCNGPVTEAINKIEKYLNTKAHESEGGYLK